MRVILVLAFLVGCGGDVPEQKPCAAVGDCEHYYCCAGVGGCPADDNAPAGFCRSVQDPL